MYEELEELRVRVTDIEKTYQEINLLVSMREERSKDIHSKVDMIYNLLIGDGQLTKPSIVTRIDRIEQSEATRKWLWAGMIGLLFNAVWEWIKSKGHGG